MGKVGQGKTQVWGPRHISLAIMTVNRDPQYVFQTIASLFASDPLVHQLGKLYLVVGSNNATYLDGLTHHKALNIVPMNDEEWLLQGLMR